MQKKVIALLKELNSLPNIDQKTHQNFVTRLKAILALNKTKKTLHINLPLSIHAATVLALVMQEESTLEILDFEGAKISEKDTQLFLQALAKNKKKISVRNLLNEACLRQALYNISEPAEISALDDSRVLMVSSFFKPRYLKTNYAERILGENHRDEIKGCSHPVFREDDLFFKKSTKDNPEDPCTDYAVASYYDIYAGVGASPTRAITLRFKGKEESFLVSLTVYEKTLYDHLDDPEFLVTIKNLSGKKDVQTHLLEEILKASKADGQKYERVLAEFSEAKDDKQIQEILMREQLFKLEEDFCESVDKYRSGAINAANRVIGMEDAKPENTLGKTMLVPIDLGDALTKGIKKIEAGKHIPEEKDILPLFPKLNKAPIVPELHERIKSSKPAVQMLNWLLKLKRENEASKKLLEEKLLSESEYRHLGYPYFLQPGTAARMYQTSLLQREFCRSHELVTQNELFEAADPLLFHYYKENYDPSKPTLENWAIISKSKNPIENLAFFKALPENHPLKIKVISSETKALDYKTQRNQTIEAAVSELMAEIKFSDYTAEEKTEILNQLILFENLETLTLQYSSNLTDLELSELVKKFPKLKSLKIKYCPNITSDALIAIHNTRPNVALEIQCCAKVATDTWPQKLAFHFAKTKNFTLLCPDGYALKYYENDLSSKNSMHQAAEKGSIDAIQALRNSVIDSYEPCNEDQETPIFSAVRAGQANVTRYFIERGVNLERVNHKKQNLLHVAATQARSEVFEILLNAIEPDAAKQKTHLLKTDYRGCSPFHLAAQANQQESLQYLFKRGLKNSLNQASLYGNPLHIAAENGHYEAACTLINLGADLNAEFRNQTAAQVAEAHAHANLARYLRACAIYTKNIDLSEEMASSKTPFQSLDLSKVAKSFAEQGQIKLKDGVLLDALDYFQRACALQPDNIAFQLLLGQVAYSCGDFKTAVSALEKSLEKEDKRIALAKQLWEKAQHTQSEKTAPFLKAKEIAKEMTQAFFNGKLDIDHPYLIQIKMLKPKISPRQKLFGREEETKTIQAIYDQVRSGHSALVLGCGLSGVGKSVLFTEALMPKVDGRGFFIKGKFEQFNKKPFLALTAALSELFKGPVQDFKEPLLRALGTNAALMTELVPELEQVIDKQKSAPDLPLGSAINRFLLVFESLIKVFLKPEHPLVILLDDLQWADDASIEVLKRLLFGGYNKYLMIVCTYRPDKPGELAPLVAFKNLLVESGTPITELQIGNLSLEVIRTLIAERVESDLASVEFLAKRIYEFTKGNPFFTQQLISFLEQTQQLVYKEAQKSWVIRDENVMQLSQDMGALMQQRLALLSQDVQKILAIAASLGNQFKLDELHVVLKKPVMADSTERLFFTLERTKEELSGLIDEAIASGLVVKSRDNPELFKFSHDSVQQAAYQSIPSNKLQAQHFHIATKLKIAYDSEKMSDEQALVVMEHVNHAPKEIPPPGPQRLFFAKLSLRAGNKAKSTLSFQTAYIFFSKGLEMLPPNSWEIQYELTQALHVECMQCGYLSNNTEHGENLFNLALKNVRSVEDKTSLFLFKMDFYIRQAKYHDAIEEGIKALDELDLKVNWKNISKLDLLTLLPGVLLNLGKWRKEQMAKLDSPDVKTLFQPIDSKIESQMRCIKKLQEAAFLAREAVFFAWLIGKNMRITKKHGVSTELTPIAVNSFATLLSTSKIFRNHKGLRKATKLSGLAYRLLEQFPSEEASTNVNFLSIFLIDVWKKNLDDSLLTPLKMNIAACTNTGSNYLIYSCFMYILYLAKSHSFAEIAKACEEYYTIVMQSNARLAITGVRMLLEINNIYLDSEKFAAKTDTKYWIEFYVKNREIGIGMLYSFLFRLLFVKGEYEAVLEIYEAMLEEIKEDDENRVTTAAFVTKCYVAMSKLQLALKCDRKDKKDSLKEIKDILEWMKESSIDCADHIHLKESLIIAESKALEVSTALHPSDERFEEHHKPVKEAFNALLRSAISCDHLPVIAIGYERFAIYCQSVNDPEYPELIKKALAAYKNWGASAKCEQLQAAHSLKNSQLFWKRETLSRHSEGSLEEKKSPRLGTRKAAGLTLSRASTNSSPAVAPASDSTSQRLWKRSPRLDEDAKNALRKSDIQLNNN